MFGTADADRLIVLAGDRPGPGRRVHPSSRVYTGPMRALTDFDPDQLRRLTHDGEPLWLDLRDPGDDQLNAVGEILGLHELAIEDSREFGQRPKLDRYGDRLLFVFFGLHLDDQTTPQLVEVHLHIAPGAVLTVSRVPPAQLDRVRRSLEPDA